MKSLNVLFSSENADKYFDKSISRKQYVGETGTVLEILGDPKRLLIEVGDLDRAEYAKKAPDSHSLKVGDEVRLLEYQPGAWLVGALRG